uniref:Uncharacterized protein n=1 Tax=Trichuris muris TaxID=70415 RepID=A0A5S6PZP0_TRIMR
MLKREADQRKAPDPTASGIGQGSSEGSVGSPREFLNSPNRSNSRGACGSGETVGRVSATKIDEAEELIFTPSRNHDLVQYGIEVSAKKLSKQQRLNDSGGPLGPPDVLKVVTEGNWRVACLKTVVWASSVVFIGWFAYATYFYINHRHHKCP